ncbi:uncharacterized protein LOC111832470 isoform X1 [Capsella rubella]|uniref:uncharacterized protein LOC111832470 isoform X1 n=1 Tax=Capsella rubella TaxID=81985 RepID=UPI000CD50EC7|nr:uncharacterized protein LOC111832470 isoform X1 [Capsella rubella]
MVELYSICGFWSYIYNNCGEFDVDLERGASLVNIDENISFAELVEVLVDDFHIYRVSNLVNLSYKIDSNLELHPLYIRIDRQLQTFLTKPLPSGGFHKLCVTIEDISFTVEQGGTTSNPFDESVFPSQAPTPVLGATTSNPFAARVLPFQAPTPLQFTSAEKDGAVVLSQLNIKG